MYKNFNSQRACGCNASGSGIDVSPITCANPCVSDAELTADMSCDCHVDANAACRCGNAPMSMAAYQSACAQNNCFSVDPAAVDNTVLAGEACETVCPGFDFGADQGPTLAKIYFPTQEYRAGYCPDEALQQGTMFPELVRLYK